VLSDYRDELLGWRTAEANRLHADLAIVCPGYAQVCRRLTAERSLAAAEQLLADHSLISAQVARRRIARLRELDGEIRALADQLTQLVVANRTRLVDLLGIGPILTARILGEVGDISRFPDADHFASANGRPDPGRLGTHRPRRLHETRTDQAGSAPRRPRTRPDGSATTRRGDLPPLREEPVAVSRFRRTLRVRGASR
jgi:transposase